MAGPEKENAPQSFGQPQAGFFRLRVAIPQVVVRTLHASHESRRQTAAYRVEQVRYAVESPVGINHRHTIVTVPSRRQVPHNIPHYPLNARVHPRAIENMRAVEKHLTCPIDCSISGIKAIGIGRCLCFHGPLLRAKEEMPFGMVAGLFIRAGLVVRKPHFFHCLEGSRSAVSSRLV